MENEIQVCKCGKPLMEHASYSNGFIEVIFDTENPVGDISLSDNAKKEIQEIIADYLGVPVTVGELQTKDETESRLADLIDCE